MSLLRLAGLAAGAGVDAVRDIDFAVEPGAGVAFLGSPRGAGETLGRTIVRLIRPSAGALLFDGRAIGDLDDDALRPLRPRLQLAFRDPRAALNPRVTVGDALCRPLATYGRAGTARDGLVLVGLPASLARRMPHQLSAEQRHRVGLARALVLRPDILVAEDPGAGLDASSRAALFDLLRRLQGALGFALLVPTAEPGVARALCEHALVLHEGRVVEHGRMAELVAAACHAHTRALMDASRAGFAPG